MIKILKLLQVQNNSINNDLINVIILTGGTGLTGGSSTPEAVKVIEKEIQDLVKCLDILVLKKLEHLLFNQRQYAAGLAKDKFIFSLPGSPSACKDAWESILKHQLDSQVKPCNLTEFQFLDSKKSKNYNKQPKS